MATGTISTTTTIAPPINFQLVEEFLARADQMCVYPSVCNPGEWEKHGGSNFTIKWLRYDQVTPTTTALAELTGGIAFVPRASNTPAVTAVTATLAKYGDYFLLNEEIDFTNPSGQSIQFMGVLGEQAGRSLNRLARDEMEDNFTQRRVGNVSADNLIVSAMTRNSITGTVAVLDTNSARRWYSMTTGSQNIGTSPIFNAYRGICHTYVRYDIERLTGFKGVETYAGQVNVLPNEFGYVDGVRWQSTEEASQGANTGGAAGSLISTGGTSADLFDSILLGQMAVGSVGLEARHPEESYPASAPPATVELIRKPPGSSGILDPFNELGTMAWKLWAVFKTVNANWGRRVTSGATSYN